MNNQFFEFAFSVFDSILATIFLLKFNGCKVREKKWFFLLFPVLVAITNVFHNFFDILAVTLSVLVSFAMLLFFQVNPGRKLRCFWSCILFFGTLMLVNYIVYNVFQLLLGRRIIHVAMELDVYISICLLSKSILVAAVLGYISINNYVEYKETNISILNLLVTALFNVLLIAIIMKVTTIEISAASILIMTGLFVSELIHYYMYARLSNQAKIELEYEMLKQKNNSEQRLYEEKKEQYEETALINHDIKNHLMHISYSINDGQYKNALNSIEAIVNKLEAMPRHVVLSNDTLNFIINYKVSEARKKGIQVSAHIENIRDCAVEDFELCALLGNILDNAIESAEKEAERHIAIEIYNHSGYQVYWVKNKIESYILKENPDLSSNKKDKANHGYGMKQVRNITSQYGGHLEIYEQAGYFNIRILLPR